MERKTVRRYRAYDPPEYVSWKPDAALDREYRERLTADAARYEITRSLTPGQLLTLYKGLLRFRLHDVALQRWVKQGVISKAWLGTGEEAVTIGAVHALRRGAGGDVVGPMIRNAGACHEMGISLADMLRAYLGTSDGLARGRDLHIGSPDCGVVAPVSMVGSLAAVMNGYALAFRQRGEDRVALTWVGDGSTKTGEVHEALNFAAVCRLPIVFVIQNNQVALGTALRRHHRAASFEDWGRAYGVPLLAVDGNNVLDVHAATVIAVRRCRSGEGPAILAAETFRMGGHATHDVQEARQTLDPALFELWGRRDPIGLYEQYLLGLDGPLGPGRPTDGGDVEAENRALLAQAEADVVEEVEAAAREALASRDAGPPASGDAEEESCYG